MMCAWKWNEFGKLTSKIDLESYLDNREYTHTQYFHYTTVKKLNSILSGESFWLSNVERFNDSDDMNQFPDKQNCFALCLSTGIHENLPMWYLYAGADGQGARLSITKNNMKDAVLDGVYELYSLDASGNKLGEYIMTLQEGTNMERSFKDIVYYKNECDTDLCDLRYNTMTNHIFPQDEFRQYQNSHIGFSKDLVWYYEKETRLFVHLTGEAAKAVEDSNQDKKYVIVWKYPERLLKNAKVLLAPEFIQGNIYNEIAKYDAIQKFLLKSSNVQTSEYAGKVKLSPCKKCKKEQEESFFMQTSRASNAGVVEEAQNYKKE